jgi:DNA repair protein RecN (Recombination protein N)
MLRFLSIRHLAVIDRLELELGPGLTVLTGETGAGKSILVGAVGLLVGGRASGDLVRTGEETATIEAAFDTPDNREIVVRREVSAQGRSRAFIAGALATTAALRDLASGLVDLHGQHEHQLLLDPASHLDVLDAYAGTESGRTAAAGAFAAWLAARTERDRVLARQRESLARRVRRIPDRRDRSRRTEAGRGRGAGRDTAGARQRGQAAAPLRRGVSGAL